MLTLEEAIEYAETVARANESLVSNYESDKRRSEIHRQLASWLRELQERRKADSCEGCLKEFGKTYLLVCASCKRRYADLYEPERRTDGQRTGD